jgi:type I restriction enzyme S subunit
MVVTTQENTIRPGYKQTEVGMIPEEWGHEKIRALASITTGKRNTQDRVDDGAFPFFVRSQTVERIDSCSFDGEAVLTAGDGVGTGKVFHYINGKFDFHQRVYKISDFRSDVDGFYCYLYFSNHFYDRIMSMTAKSSVDSVRLEMIADMQVPVPPVTEQRAIGAALSDVDTLIAALDMLITKKRNIKTAAMQQLLTGKQRLPGFYREREVKPRYKQTEAGVIPEDWGVGKLGDCLTATPDYGINAAAVPFADKLPVYIRITDITEGGRFSPEKLVSVEGADTERYFLNEGELVFARTGASVGKSYLYNPADGKLVFAGFLIRVKPNQAKLIPGFLASYVQTGCYWDWVNVMSMRSGQPGINGNEYAQLPIPLPTVEEQAAIATALSDMDAEIAALQTRRDKTHALKQGMMQQLLTGNIRLK